VKLSELYRQATRIVTQLPDAAGVALFCHGKLLLCKRAPHMDDPELWSVPGGLLEGTERPWGAAKRELVEETGSLPPGFGKAAHKYTWTNPNTKLTYQTFLVQLPPATRDLWQPRLNDEHTQWDWYGPQDARAISLHPGVAKLLANDLFDRTVRPVATPKGPL